MRILPRQDPSEKMAAITSRMHRRERESRVLSSIIDSWSEIELVCVNLLTSGVEIRKIVNGSGFWRPGSVYFIRNGLE